MGFNDRARHYRSEFPVKANSRKDGPFDPDDEWLKDAPEEDQIEAMRRWFHARYEDPANETPYSSEDGGYLFVWGGPYDPSDEIQERFGGVIPYEVMEKLIHELWSEAGDEWAPIEHEGVDYFEDFSFRVVDRADPLRLLELRLKQIDAVLNLSADPSTSDVVRQMAHGSLIAALEAFLADTVSYWIRTDKSVFRRFVSQNKDFKERKLSLDQIFERLDGLELELEQYLQEIPWHRLDKIRPMMVAGLSMGFPTIEALMKEVVIRHDMFIVLAVPKTETWSRYPLMMSGVCGIKCGNLRRRLRGSWRSAFRA
jgi:hypothetical protein